MEWRDLHVPRRFVAQLPSRWEARAGVAGKDERIPSFGPVVMRALVGVPWLVFGRIRLGSCSSGMVGSVVVVLEPPVVEEHLRFEERVEAFHLVSCFTKV